MIHLSIEKHVLRDHYAKKKRNWIYSLILKNLSVAPINDPISIQQGYTEKCFFPSLSDFLNMVLFKGKALSIIQQHLSCHRKVIIVNKHKRRIQNNDWHFCLSFKSQLVSVNFQITLSQKCSRKTNYFQEQF